MAEILRRKISELPSIGYSADDMQVPVIHNGQTYRIDRSVLLAAPPSPGAIRFSRSDIYVLESGGYVDVTVQRVDGSFGAASARVVSTNGTAIAGVDYTAVNQVLTWGDGDDADKTVRVTVFDNDTALESDFPAVTLHLVLQEVTGADRGRVRTININIVDDEHEPVTIDLFPVVASPGQVAVQLHPQASVTLGQATLFAAGFVLPQGLVADASTIRLLNAQGAEIPIYVEETTRWHVYPGAPAGVESVRSVLIWAEMSFASHDPVDVSVAWGVARAQTMADPGVTPQSTWASIAGHEDPGEYPASAGITEPKVYLTMPTDWLSKCYLRTPTTPMYNDPSLLWLDMSWLGFSQTAVNDVGDEVYPSNLIDLTQYEPWLYDRALTLWGAYARTGQIKWLRHAHRASQYYASKLDVNGWFTLKSGQDAKYSYGACLLLDYMLSGDAGLPAKITTMADTVFEGYLFKRILPYTTTRNFWTERHLSYLLLSFLSAWELTGGAGYLGRIQDVIAAVAAHQTTSQGTFAGAPWPIDGGLLHTMDQHEGGGGAIPIASPWMSALLSEAMMRVFVHSRDLEPLRVIARLGDYVVACTLYQADEIVIDGQTMTVPYYLASSVYQHYANGDNQWNDWEHCLDVAAMIYRAAWAKTMLAEDPHALLAAAETLMLGAETCLDEWHRPGSDVSAGLPVWRLSPPRKYSWWFGCASDLGWLKTAMQSWATTAGRAQFVTTSAQVNELDGAVELIVERAHGQLGAVSVVWQAVSGTATVGADLPAQSGVLAWANGQWGRQTISVAITHDAERAETAETFSVALSTPTGGLALGDADTCVVTIINAEHFELTAGAFEVAEDAGTLAVTVQRLGSTAAASLRLATTNGTAVAGTDYTATDTTVTWADGDGPDKTVSIPITHRTGSQASRQFSLALSEPVGGALGALTTATVTITDVDPIPLFSDSFNREDSDDLGEDWSDPCNYGQIVDGAVKSTMNTVCETPKAALITVAGRLTNYRYTVNIDTTSYSYASAQVHFAVDDDSKDAYFLLLSRENWTLYRATNLGQDSKAAGNYDAIPTVVGANKLNAAAREIRVEHRAPEITVFIDGHQLIQWTDPAPLAAGYCGLAPVQSAANAGVKYLDVAIVQLP
ncbi:Calx-beta domain-containing protein [Desulfarculus baarsii]